MVSKRLIAFWAISDVFLLAAGVLSIAMSIAWRAPNLMLNFTLTSSDLLCTYPTPPTLHIPGSLRLQPARYLA